MLIINSWDDYFRNLKVIKMIFTLNDYNKCPKSLIIDQTLGYLIEKLNKVGIDVTDDFKKEWFKIEDKRVNRENIKYLAKNDIENGSCGRLFPLPRPQYVKFFEKYFTTKIYDLRILFHSRTTKYKQHCFYVEKRNLYGSEPKYVYIGRKYANN